MKPGLAVQFVAIVMLLGVIAAVTPQPSSDDRGLYGEIGRRILIRDCTDLACARVLLAGVLEHLPGPSLLKWKTYAVLANAGAAVAVGRLCMLLGLSTRAARFAMWIDAFGSGPLYAVYDCYTSGPLMYLLGPRLSTLLLQDRRGWVGIIAGLAVFAKEFAAAPLWIFTFAAALQRRWDVALRTLVSATTVVLIWLVAQAFLMALFNYGFGKNRSADLLHGGFLTLWLSNVGLPPLCTCSRALAPCICSCRLD